MRAVGRFPLWVWPILFSPVLIAGYYTLGRLAGPTAVVTQSVYSLSSVIAVTALVVAATRHGRGGRGPWLALAAGQAAMMTGDLTYFVVARDTGTVTYPGPPDVCYLLGYLGLAGGLLWLVRRRTPGWNMPSVIDAAVVVVGASLVGWVYIIEPLSAGTGGAAQAVTVAYPVMDLALLAFGARLMLGAAARPASFWLLMAWLVAVLVGDTAYSLQALQGTYAGFVDGLWIVGVSSLAAAGLHPSALLVDEPSSVTAPDATAGRLTVLAVTSLLAPAVLAVQYARGSALHVPAVVVSCVVLFLLVLARMAGLVWTQRMMAITDGLTGLRTRRFLEAALHNETDRVRHGGPPFGFILIDVDHFKAVNDTHGHQAGDRVLVELGRRLRAMARQGDVVARYGGEEFAVLLPGVHPPALQDAARRFHHGLASVPFVIGEDRLLAVTASIGAACMSDGRQTVEDLTRITDQALYAAKDAGRDRVVLAGSRAMDSTEDAAKPSVDALPAP